MAPFLLFSMVFFSHFVKMEDMGFPVIYAIFMGTFYHAINFIPIRLFFISEKVEKIPWKNETGVIFSILNPQPQVQSAPRSSMKKVI